MAEAGSRSGPGFVRSSDPKVHSAPFLGATVPRNVEGSLGLAKEAGLMAIGVRKIAHSEVRHLGEWMAIPQFDDLGLLPPGVVDATLEEIAEMFCWNDHRRSLWDSFLRFVEVEYRSNKLTFPLWIDGSFVRSKAVPSDIDVVMDLVGVDDRAALLAAYGVRLKHDEIKRSYGVDLWVKHPAIPNDLTSFFQYVGDKCAAEKQIDPKHPKGILRTWP